MRLFCFSAIILSTLLFDSCGPGISGGTGISMPLVSKNVNVLDEQVVITLDSSFKKANVSVLYHIQSDSAGEQVPMLFATTDKLEGFKVWVDEDIISTKEIPDTFKSIQQFDSLKIFDRYLTLGDTLNKRVAHMFWDSLYDQDDSLYYFKANLSKGTHIIEVGYVYTPWIYPEEWLNNYSYQYSLSPLKYWKSFGTLEIVINAIKCKVPFTTNLGVPTSGRQDSIAVWRFHQLTKRTFELSFQPQLSPMVKTLKKIDPFVPIPTFILIGILVLLHILYLIRFRKYGKGKRWMNIVASLIIPLLPGIIPLFEWIAHAAAGQYASQPDDSGFFCVFLVLVYPIIMIGYLVLMVILDLILKYIFKRKTTNL